MKQNALKNEMFTFVNILFFKMQYVIFCFFLMIFYEYSTSITFIFLNEQKFVDFYIMQLLQTETFLK
jgi:hypothetical protein